MSSGSSGGACLHRFFRIRFGIPHIAFRGAFDLTMAFRAPPLKPPFRVKLDFLKWVCDDVGPYPCLTSPAGGASVRHKNQYNCHDGRSKGWGFSGGPGIVCVDAAAEFAMQCKNHIERSRRQTVWATTCSVSFPHTQNQCSFAAEDYNFLSSLFQWQKSRVCPMYHTRDIFFPLISY